MAENICFFIRTFLIASSILILFGKVTIDVNQCGSLKIEQPTISGRNVTFTFTPETTSDADLKWQRTNKRNPWSTLPNDNKFTQYSQDGTYYLILTNSVTRDDEVFYRVNYTNNSVRCLMETPKLQLQVAPSAPAFEGLKDIDDCTGCIVGEDGDQFSVLCKTSGGTQPITVNMSIGNEEQSPNRYDKIAGYMAFFTLLNRHHMAIMKCKVMNDALTSPLIITARVYVIIPPSTINLEVKVEQTLPLEIYAICTIHNSNPACGVNISASNGVIVSERYTNNVSQPHGAWNSEYAVNLTVGKDDDGTKIECAADCQNFAVDLKDARTIVLPYAPTIEFNISGSELAILQGEQAHVNCSAQSIPASNISWVEQSDVGNITMKRCQLKTDCVISIEANLTQQRKFICQTLYLQTSDQKTLTVNILEKDEKRSKILDNSASGDNLFIWIILGSCLAVLFVVVIVCLIARKALRNTKDKLDANQVRFSASPDRVRNKEDKLEDDPHGNLNDGAHGFDDSEVTYSQPVKDKALSIADATYSEVNKTGKSNCSARCPQKTQQDGHLLYADLDFDCNGAPLKGAAAKRRNSPTEYVDIDFVKTAAEKAKESEPAEADNIYANQ